METNGEKIEHRVTPQLAQKAENKAEQKRTLTNNTTTKQKQFSDSKTFNSPQPPHCTRTCNPNQIKDQLFHGDIKHKCISRCIQGFCLFAWF